MLGIYAKTFMIAARMNALERQRTPHHPPEERQRKWWLWRRTPRHIPDPAPLRL